MDTILSVREDATQCNGQLLQCNDDADDAQDYESKVVVNLQGDEPLMPADCLDQVAELLSQDDSADAASLWWPATDAAEVEDPNVYHRFGIFCGRA